MRFRSSRPTRPERGPLAVAVAVLSLSLAGCGKPALLNDVAPKKGSAQAARMERAARAAQRQEASRRFVAFALNAFLVPLFDDDSPPRWADPTLAYDCETLDVQVDDAPVDVGAPVHDGGFTVRWHMERCTPFDGTAELTGDIGLKVERIGGGYEVALVPTQLHVVSAQGHEVLPQPFTARTSLRR